MRSRLRAGKFRRLSEDQHLVVVGGGAAGFFAANTAAEGAPGCRILVLEKSASLLSKVRISGGGRCNVTHACFDPKILIGFYPRGARELLGPFHRFQCRDTMDWFEARGVKLKIEEDRRVFPKTDDSQTIIECLTRSVRGAGVAIQTNCGVEEIRAGENGFDLSLSNKKSVRTKFLMIATGGCRTAAMAAPFMSLGHSLIPPVPSLFSLHLDVPWLNALAGVSLSKVGIRAEGIASEGALLITHQGLSGPVVLKLSAWGARRFSERAYKFMVEMDWLPDLAVEDLIQHFDRARATEGAKLVCNVPLLSLPARLWSELVRVAGITKETRWAGLPRSGREQLVRVLKNLALPVQGKSLNKEEFVTCGGVPLAEVNFKTMESKLCRNLFFAGEVLDIDGVTGGFNFQSAWTTGWIAGQALAERLKAAN